MLFNMAGGPAASRLAARPERTHNRWMPTLPSGPSDAEEAEAPTLKVAVVARRLGVAPATLRTWARRYGLGPSTHVAGAHRQYSAADLTRLVVMRRLTLEGVSPAEAARVAVGTDPAYDDGAAPVTALLRLHDRLDDQDVLAADEVDGDGGGGDDDRTTYFGRAGGGRVVAMPTSGPAARGLARAALSLDADGCRRLLQAAIARDGVETAWEELARPVLVAIGERWESTGSGVDVEHLLTEVVLSSLRCAPPGTGPRSASSVLLACAEHEDHSLPLHVLAAVLGERGVTVRLLGARVPRRALADAVRRSGPAAVLVYATMPPEDSGGLSELPRLRPAPRLFVGGSGWSGVALPGGTRRLLSLTESVEDLMAAVGA